MTPLASRSGNAVFQLPALSGRLLLLRQWHRPLPRFWVPFDHKQSVRAKISPSVHQHSPALMAFFLPMFSTWNFDSPMAQTFKRLFDCS
jgi:hypothetical protein